MTNINVDQLHPISYGFRAPAPYKMLGNIIMRTILNIIRMNKTILTKFQINQTYQAAII